MLRTSKQSGRALTEIVLVGGGHTHVQVLRSFGMRPQPGTRLTLVARDLQTPYSGMLPGLIAGHYRFEECHIDLAPLAHFAGAQLVHAEADGLDLAAGAVRLRDRLSLPFDLISIDTGITPSLNSIAGAREHAIPVKPIGRFLERWRKVEALAHDSGDAFRLVVVGAGAGGVELVLAARHRLGSIPCTLIGAGGLLPSHPPAVQAAFARILAERGIDLVIGIGVTAIEPGRVRCADGRTVAADAVLLVTAASAPAWLESTGLPLDPHGFLVVGADLRSPGDPRVFAAGDVASVLPHPRPKAGVFAVRQGPPLSRNLRRAAEGKEPLPFTPQRRFLSLISTGDRYAVASRGGLKLEGAWLWRVKDLIDRRFMRRFQKLPARRPPDLP